MQTFALFGLACDPNRWHKKNNFITYMSWTRLLITQSPFHSKSHLTSPLTTLGYCWFHHLSRHIAWMYIVYTPPLYKCRCLFCTFAGHLQSTHTHLYKSIKGWLEWKDRKISSSLPFPVCHTTQGYAQLPLIDRFPAIEVFYCLVCLES